jgi:hypothetical protein
LLQQQVVVVVAVGDTEDTGDTREIYNRRGVGGAKGAEKQSELTREQACGYK